MNDALQNYLDSVRATHFEWGVHDCAMFPARGVDAVHGTDFAYKVRAHGVTSAEDYRRLQRSGVTLKTLATDVLGSPSDGTPARGDVALVKTDRGMALGIAVPPLILCAGLIGSVPVPMSSMICFWRVS